MHQTYSEVPDSSGILSTQQLHDAGFSLLHTEVTATDQICLIVHGNLHRTLLRISAWRLATWLPSGPSVAGCCCQPTPKASQFWPPSPVHDAHSTEASGRGFTLQGLTPQASTLGGHPKFQPGKRVSDLLEAQLAISMRFHNHVDGAETPPAAFSEPLLSSQCCCAALSKGFMCGSGSQDGAWPFPPPSSANAPLPDT